MSKSTLSRSVYLRPPGDMLKDDIVLHMIRRTSFRNRRLLDVGCGMGHTLSCLSDALDSLEVVGLDVAREKLEVATRVVNGSFALGDGAALPFKDGSFSYVVLKDVLEHVQDGQCVIEEVHRVLVDDGRLVIYVPHSLEGYNFSLESVVQKLSRFTIDGRVGHLRRYRKSEIANALTATGFEIDDAFYYAHFLFGFISIIVVLGRPTVEPRIVSAFGSNKGRFMLTGIGFIVAWLKLLGMIELKLLRRCRGPGLFVSATKVTRAGPGQKHRGVVGNS